MDVVVGCGNFADDSPVALRPKGMVDARCQGDALACSQAQSVAGCEAALFAVDLDGKFRALLLALIGMT